MTLYRLSWTQHGQRHCQDYDDLRAADAAFVLGHNYSAKDIDVSALPPCVPFDLRGPRPLTGREGQPLLNPEAWSGNGADRAKKGRT